MKSFKQFLKEDEHNFYSEQMSDEQQQSHYDHANSFDHIHRWAIKQYKDDSNTFVNYGLRNPNNHKEDGKIRHENPSYVEQMDHVTGNPLKHDYVAYRGFSSHTPSREIAAMKPGETFTDHGYTGTTLHPQIADFFSYTHHHTPEGIRVGHIAKIHIPAGTKGHYLEARSGIKEDYHDSEKELLLHRGTKFEVMKHETIPENKLHVTHLKVVGQEPKKVVRL